MVYGSPEEGWYECELRGQVGMVPANYVRLLHTEPSQQASNTGGISNKNGGATRDDDSNKIRRANSHESGGNNIRGARGLGEIQEGLGQDSEETLDKRRQVFAVFCYHYMCVYV